MSQQQQKRSRRSGDDEPVEESEGRQDPLPGVDAILDEIDEMLEQNAEVFVKEFVQRGGQ